MTLASSDIGERGRDRLVTHMRQGAGTLDELMKSLLMSIKIAQYDMICLGRAW